MHSMIGTLVVVEQDRTEKRKQAYATYARLLEHGKESKDPHDLKAFRDACSTLGKVKATAGVDLQTIELARDLERQIKAGMNLNEQRGSADEAVKASLDERRRLLDEWDERHRQKLALVSELANRVTAAENATKSLQSLKAEHGELLQFIDVPQLHDAAAAAKAAAEAMVKAKADAAARVKLAGELEAKVQAAIERREHDKAQALIIELGEVTKHLPPDVAPVWQRKGQSLALANGNAAALR